MKKIKLFGGMLRSQEKWLNSMADQGYRLVKTGKMTYEFEECEPGKYRYAVEYVGNKDYEELKRYHDFLKEFGYNVFYKNINLNYSFGKVRFRLYKSKPWEPATNSTTFNKEILLVEKENDGKEFNLHTTSADLADYYKNVLYPYVMLFALFAVLAIVMKSIAFAIIAALLFVPMCVFGCRFFKEKGIGGYRGEE
ncbi:MAG: DUF2812 domain-containing protein [Lachnospiraceae bacterium]|nr:DUF2812 domain-containing protein [Lachnospiraceae bacterium]